MQKPTLGIKNKKMKIIFFKVFVIFPESQEEGESGGWEEMELTVPGIKPDMLKSLIKVVN